VRAKVPQREIIKRSKSFEEKKSSYFHQGASRKGIGRLRERKATLSGGGRVTGESSYQGGKLQEEEGELTRRFGGKTSQGNPESSPKKHGKGELGQTTGGPHKKETCKHRNPEDEHGAGKNLPWGAEPGRTKRKTLNFGEKEISCTAGIGCGMSGVSQKELGAKTGRSGRV